MDTFEVGEKMTVRFISEELEEDMELLHYLDKHGLKPGQYVIVNDRVPSAGLLVLGVNGEDVSLGLPVASRMRAETVS
jgi:hypothetical protein